MTVEGADRHAQRLRRFSEPGALRFISKALFVAGDKVRVAAQISITEGSVSGKNHVPSKPGEPPNQDTGVLGNNIEVTQPSDFEVEISSNAPYSSALEFGTSRVQARPFMRPAIENTKDDVQKLISRAVAHVVKNS